MTQMTEGPYCLHVAQRKGSWKLLSQKNDTSPQVIYRGKNVATNHCYKTLTLLER